MLAPRAPRRPRQHLSTEYSLAFPRWTLPSILCIALTTILAATSAHGATPVCAASELCSPSANPCTISSTRDVARGCHLDFGSRNVVVSGALQAASGGSFSLAAGSLTLAAGRIRAVGPAGSAGGNVSIQLSGALVMSGAGPTLDVGGAAGGGILEVRAGSIDVRAGSVEADGTGSEACGGAITLQATAGPLLLAAPVHATGHFLCAGGQLDLSGNRVEVNTSLNVSGGDYPGGIVVTASAGDVVIGSTATLRASGEQIETEDGGDGGPVTILAEAGNVSLLGSVTADGASPEGEGGSIEIITSGTLQVGGALSVQGNGAESTGGAIAIDAVGAVTFTASARASGGSAAAGGEIDVRSDGAISVGAGRMLQANGGLWGGGMIALRDATTITVAGTLETKGSGGGNGGFSTLESCRATVSGTLDATASGGGLSGGNSITAGVITVAAGGRLIATPCNPLVGASCNQLTLAAGAPLLDPLAVLSPLASLTLDPLLNSCCGNSTLEPGETCDDGNGAACDGCSHTCQTETVPPCPSDGNECTADCTPDAGCTYKPRTGQACTDDGNSCTSDVCTAGAQCAHPQRVCNDGIACTVDSCAPGVGCVATPDDARCDDEESCTSDACNGATGCEHVAATDDTPCNDGDLCTTGDACEGGVCTPQGAPLNCDDGDACTTDACFWNVGCHSREDADACPCGSPTAPLPAGSRCVDGNECSEGDTCDGSGNCLPGPICASDTYECTEHYCLPIGPDRELCLVIDNQCPTSCVGQADGTPCSDQSACTEGTCQAGTCVSVPLPCGDGDDCNGVEYCIDVFGCRGSAPPIGDPLCELPTEPLDAFTCYRAKATKGAPRFDPLLGAPVQDRFFTALADLRRDSGLCLPTSVNGAEPGAPSHPDVLTSYLTRVRDAVASGAPRTGITVTSQLGALRVDLKKLDGVMLPGALGTVTPPAPPVPPDPDRFACYKVSLALGEPKFLPIFGIAIADRLGTHTVDVKRPTRLCTPLDLNGEDPTTPQHPGQLLCYQVRTSPGTPRFVKQSALLLANELGSETLDLAALEEICLPAAISAP